MVPWINPPPGATKKLNLSGGNEFLFERGQSFVKTSGFYSQLCIGTHYLENLSIIPRAIWLCIPATLCVEKFLNRYIPLSEVSYASVKMNPKYREYVVPSKLQKGSSKRATVSFLVGTKCHTSPICPIVYHTDRDEIECMSAISCLTPYCVVQLQKGTFYDMMICQYID